MMVESHFSWRVNFPLMQYNRIGWGEVTVGHSCQIQRIAVPWHFPTVPSILQFCERARGEKTYDGLI